MKKILGIILILFSICAAGFAQEESEVVESVETTTDEEAPPENTY